MKCPASVSSGHDTQSIVSPAQIATLRKVDGNRTRAVQILSVSRQTLQNK
ncbi:MAG: helix-turn-helix domain-containing protein [Geoalkalibacter sp.]